MSILFISNNNFSDGLSGGDRIFIELLRRWSKTDRCGLVGSSETKSLISRFKVSRLTFYQSCSSNLLTYPNTINIVIHQIIRTFCGCFYVLKNQSTLSQYSHIYAVSDFFPDLFPSVLLKILHPSTKLICGFYLLAPSPHNQNSPYLKNHQIVKNYLYFYFQKISLYLIRRYSDIVFITSEPDIWLFPTKKIVVVKGGVDITPSTKWFQKHRPTSISKRKYLACYLGRLHPQKGVILLPQIWKQVIKALPHAKLAIIGNGQLETELRQQIKRLNLQNNISLFGFNDGSLKYKIFRSSVMILHPATFDSGGMAAAEGMAWKLPGVSFDLDSLKTYYPKGVIKVPPTDITKFAKAIIKLASSSEIYKTTATEAYHLTREFWDWDKRATDIYHQII